MLSLCIAAIAAADDWPQYMGPQRDNVWRETGIVKELPADGPKIVWRVPVAGGYAGPSIAGGKVYVADYVTADNVKVANFERKESTGTERVLCLDEKTGQEIWHHEYPVKYTVSYPAGPRCVPNVQRRQSLHARRRGRFLVPRRGDRQSHLVEELAAGVSHQDGSLGLCRPSAHRRQEADRDRRRRGELRRCLRQGHRRRAVARPHVARARLCLAGNYRARRQAAARAAAARCRDVARSGDRP